ncbi:hypothetical protein [Chitinophaga sp. S165]|uniref:hypothetical protein n=1 Tax=Chitinophaga sp. S165 TaxID=2135462 RepID=UPI000D71A6C0|nr:hypothetical protein [Chitinophaga sp. S165]PWV49098.1 hypothetical protein C7475_106344 [Chitinophaga sp. S165]
MTYNNDENIAFEKCINFLNSIGIKTIFRKIGTNSFLPGLLVENGMIVIDKDTLEHPGDILHEAGHLAVVPTKHRHSLTEKNIIKRSNREGEEMMAIAWSYAACMHLMIDPFFVFHEQGYRGGSQQIVDSCGKNDYIGLLMLQAAGMTTGEKMIKWLRE